MKVLNNLHMTVNGSMVAVGWTELNGNRMHVWLDMYAHEPDEPLNGGFTPVEPYRVTREYELKTNAFTGQRILYRNPPEGIGPRDTGYFQTRKLDADAKAWRTVVAEALDRAQHEGLFAKAVQANVAAKEAEERAKVLGMAKRVRERLEMGFDDGELTCAAARLSTLPDEALAKLGFALRAV